MHIKSNKEMRNYKAEQIAKRIKNASEWNMDDCADLCGLAGMEEEWNNANGETFESVVYRAAEILKVEI